MDTDMESSEPWQNLSNDVQNALVYLYQNRLHTDVTFFMKSKGVSMCCRCFCAHKLVLATVSPVFAELWENQDNKPTIIKNEEISARGFDILLWYVYSGILDIQSPDELAEASKAAQHYDVQSLLSACKEHLLRYSINAGNVFSILETMNHLNIATKRKECLDIVESETVRVIHTPGFLKADPEMARKVLQKSRLAVEPKELVEIAIKWIKSNKVVDKNLLSCLDFSSVSSTDFIDLARKFPDFFNPDELLRILSNFTKPGIMEYPSWYTISKKNDIINRPVLFSDVGNTRQQRWRANVTSKRYSRRPGPAANFHANDEDICNMIKRRSVEVKTLCRQSLWKGLLFERDGFEASMALEIKHLHSSPEALRLVMFEFAFGCTFIPEDCLDLNIYFFGLGPMQEKQQIKYCLISTPQHFYVILDHPLKLQIKRPLMFTIEINARGLRKWGQDGPVSNEQYRVAMIPKHISDNICENRSRSNNMLSLIPLTDWIAFIDPEIGGKHFIITSLFLNTDANYKKVLKAVGL